MKKLNFDELEFVVGGVTDRACWLAAFGLGPSLAVGQVTGYVWFSTSLLTLSECFA